MSMKCKYCDFKADDSMQLHSHLFIKHGKPEANVRQTPDNPDKSEEDVRLVKKQDEVVNKVVGSETNGSEEYWEKCEKIVTSMMENKVQSVIGEDGLTVWDFAELRDGFIELLAKAKCAHQESDPKCPCFTDGFETADAENCYEKLQEQRERILQDVRLGKRTTKAVSDQIYNEGWNDCIDELEKKMEGLK